MRYSYVLILVQQTPMDDDADVLQNPSLGNVQFEKLK